ncbi:MAG: DUF2169 domain-containing protein [Polyangiaceae bacterium]
MTMSQMQVFPITVAPIGPVSTGWLVFRRHPDVRLAVVAKATFGFEERGESAGVGAERGALEPPWMQPLAPQPLFADDRNHLSMPTASVEFPGDFAPYLGRTDVVLNGLVHPPATAARLLLGRHGNALLDKTVFVTDPNRSPSNPIPLTYEHTYGGPTNAENPVGRLSPALWNGHSLERVAGMGALSRHWPARARLLEPAQFQPRPSGFVEVPPDFAWDALQAAPADQRLPFLHGDEWIRVEGVAHRRARLVGRLPALTARAEEAGRPVPALSFVIDQLLIDGAARRCHVRFRALMPWSGETRDLRVEVLAHGAPLSLEPSTTGATALVPAWATSAAPAGPAPALPFATPASARPRSATPVRGLEDLKVPAAVAPAASPHQSTTAPANLSIIGDLGVLLGELPE